MKLKFAASVVIDAADEEEALRLIGGRIVAVARRMSNGIAIADSDPFFTLTEVTKGDAVDLKTPLPPIEQPSDEGDA